LVAAGGEEFIGGAPAHADVRRGAPLLP